MAVGTCQGSQPLGLTQVVETVGVTPAIPPGGVGGGGEQLFIIMFTTCVLYQVLGNVRVAIINLCFLTEHER